MKDDTYSGSTGTTGTVTRPDILPEVLPRYEHDWEAYPDSIRVSFGDGKTVRYFKEIKQPEPVLGKMLDRFEERFVLCGYKYKQKNRGKRRGDENNVNGETGEHSVQAE